MFKDSLIIAHAVDCILRENGMIEEVHRHVLSKHCLCFLKKTNFKLPFSAIW